VTGVAGDLEDRLADAAAEAVVKLARERGGLAKSDASELRLQAWAAAREVAAEIVTPVLKSLEGPAGYARPLAERIAWLEEQRRQQAAGNWSSNG
jgi:hypothetical protein